MLYEVITDHLGEFGVHDVETIADVKLLVPEREHLADAGDEPQRDVESFHGLLSRDPAMLEVSYNFV